MAKIYYCTNQAKIVFQKKKKEKSLYPKGFYINSKGFKCSFGKRKTLNHPLLPQKGHRIQGKNYLFCAPIYKKCRFSPFRPQSFLGFRLSDLDAFAA